MTDEEGNSSTPRLAPNQPSNQQEIDSRSVYLGNVDYSAVPGDIKELLDDCGVINRITILYNKHSGMPRGYAFVEFETHEAVQKAIQMNGNEFLGRALTITPKRTNFPGMAKRGGRPSTGPRRGRPGRGGGVYRGRPRPHADTGAGTNEHSGEDTKQDLPSGEPNETSPEVKKRSQIFQLIPVLSAIMTILLKLVLILFLVWSMSPPRADKLSLLLLISSPIIKDRLFSAAIFDPRFPTVSSFWDSNCDISDAL
ncbi:hypothetical protein OGAPHI_006770 [Ogataea philodendri]|uniref:RRM domain-containing protein n=1 Tax=Ogataea philodendri TaxID=1378263 RepID=A0A9P8NWV6_9ASCO|nr:uncharacterized protein OGAPHI_006770 [Ogataea philodendri]KAH3661363.1 hypothetical protein OGAPHI_006770 [Ogataea philodendri]